MASRSRHYYSTPVYEEVRPSYLNWKTRSTPSPPSSPKAVRFTREAVTKPEPRQWTKSEAWSLWHFEAHARECHDCYSPRDYHQLCSKGHYLAKDVDKHMHYLDGDFYSRKKEHDKHVRIQVQTDYSHGCQLLRTVEHARRMARHHREQSSRTSHPADPERSDLVRTPAPQSRAHRGDEWFYCQPCEDEPIEAAKSHGRSKHKSSDYKTDSPKHSLRVHSRPEERRGSGAERDRDRLRSGKPDITVPYWLEYAAGKGQRKQRTSRR